MTPRIPKKARADLNRLIASGLVAPDKPGKKDTTYSPRLVPEGQWESDTYPGFEDDPSSDGDSYLKHVDLSGFANVWEAVSNDHYVLGGMPTFLRESLSDLDMAIYFHIAHHQMAWGGVSRTSIRTISRNYGRPYRSIQRSMRRLREVGAIVLVKRHSGRSPAHYRVVLLSLIEPPKSPRLKGEREENISSVDTTEEYVDTTVQNSIHDRTVTQKEKLPKEFSTNTGASAPGFVSNKEQKQPNPKLQTINEKRKADVKARNSKLQRQKKTERARIFRPFLDHEITEQILTELIESIPDLKSKAILGMESASCAGDFLRDTGTILPHRCAEDSGLIFELQRLLKNSEFSIRNLPQAVNSCLIHIHTRMEVLSKSNRNSQYTWKREKEQEIENEEEARKRSESRNRDQLAKEAKERERVEMLKLVENQKEKERSDKEAEILEKLNFCRARLNLLDPAIETKVVKLGVVHVLTHSDSESVFNLIWQLSILLAQFHGDSELEKRPEDIPVEWLESWYSYSIPGMTSPSTEINTRPALSLVPSTSETEVKVGAF